MAQSFVGLASVWVQCGFICHIVSSALTAPSVPFALHTTSRRAQRGNIEMTLTTRNFHWSHIHATVDNIYSIFFPSVGPQDKDIMAGAAAKVIKDVSFSEREWVCSL